MFRMPAVLPLFVVVLPGQGFPDFCPAQTEVVLNTDLTQVVPCSGAPYNVVGGVFRFHDVTIPQGVTVRGEGSRPMIFLVTGDFVVDGTLTVDGGQGQMATTISAANFPVQGGRGNCGGGNGGRGSPQPLWRSFAGEDGFGPGQVPSGGGAGAPAFCLFSAGSEFAPGGGGGSLRTFGDPALYGYYQGGASVAQVLGFGGFGGINRSQAGGFPGGRAFSDLRNDNDFWGSTYDVARARWIVGELPVPVGGAGGGGGGDRTLDCSATAVNYIHDKRGGGGGGGAGVLIVGALGHVVVGPTGRITANGGNGGGGEYAGSCDHGGGGGGGSGGWIVLASDSRVELHAHGETYANGDASFVVSADGGIGAANAFTGTGLFTKYPFPSNPSLLDTRGFGGFGGLGVVQLVVRPGDNSDGTNTMLDDNVRIFRNGALLSGAQKQRFLGWRGVPDPSGLLYVDDNGVPVLLGDGDGDIRPAPVLMPLF